MKLDHPNEGSLIASPRWSGGVRHRRQDESGQAMVEFALILFPLLLIVVGIIQFGIGLNYWLDMQRIANQGARFAVVNDWPGCPPSAATYANGGCTTTPSCTSVNTNTTLQQELFCSAMSVGLRDSLTVSICYPDDGDPNTGLGTVGTPVRVNLSAPYDFLPIIGVGSLTLRSEATMRLEQPATHLSPSTPTC